MKQEFGPERVPEKYFSKWLRIVELKIWIGFAEFVLSLVTIAGLTIFIGNKFPEALKYLPAIAGTICSLAAGIAIGIDKYRNRK